MNLETQFPWWLNKNTFAAQLFSIGLESRSWFLKKDGKHIMTGYFIGLYTGMGLYDFQFRNDNGYQGEFYIPAGISSGYVMPIISKNFSLEFSIGIGYMRSHYRRYNISENGRYLIRQHSGRYEWLGPTKAKVSFSWLLNRKTKRTAQ